LPVDGRTIVERLLNELSPNESDETVVMRAMRLAFYSLLVVESVRRGVGAVVRDLRTGQARLVINMGLGATARPGIAFAGGMLGFEGFAMTTGATLPIGVVDPAQQELLTKRFPAEASDEGVRFDPAGLIAECMRETRNTKHGARYFFVAMYSACRYGTGALPNALSTVPPAVKQCVIHSGAPYFSIAAPPSPPPM
jgi:hypothetical protein